MNPRRIAERLRTDYLQLLTTTFAPRQERLKRDFRSAVEREGSSRARRRPVLGPWPAGQA